MFCTLTIYIGILYHSMSIYGLAVVEICLPILSWILMKIAIRKINIHLYMPIGVAEKHQSVNVGVEIESKSVIPIFHVTARVRIKNKFYDTEQISEVFGMVVGKSKTKMTMKISSEYCGPIVIEIDEVRINDLFHLSTTCIPIHQTERLSVLPEYYAASFVLQESIRDFMAESEIFDKNCPGDDPSEIFQVREYHGGDRMQSIHWKLSARTDEMMVKDYSLPIGNAVIVFWDMFYNPEKIEDSFDEWLEAGLAISQGLVEVGCEHYAVWFDKKQQDLERMEMKKMEDLYLLTDKIFSSGPYLENVMIEELYKEKYRGETWHTQLRLNIEKELWKNGELYMDLNGCAKETLNNEIVL